MKRPIAIYVVAIWTYFQSAIYVAIPLLIIGKFLKISSDLIHIVWTCISILIIILMVGLVLLRRIPRIITIILLSIACIIIVKISVTMPIGEIFLTISFIPAKHPLPAYIIYPVFFFVNIICIWYLIRKNFIKFSNEYRLQIKKREKTVPTE
jgi:hypothetical protein